MSDRSRWIITLVLCAGIFIGSQYFFASQKKVPEDKPLAEEVEKNGSDGEPADKAKPDETPDPVEEEKDTVDVDKPDDAQRPAEEESDEKPADEDPATPQDAPADDGPQIEADPLPVTLETVALRSDYLELDLTTHGAALNKLKITDKDGPRYGIELLGYVSDELPELKHIEKRPSLLLSDENDLGLDKALWRWANKGENNDSVAVFVWEKSGIRITKTFDITPGEKHSTCYGVRLSLKIETIGKTGITALNLNLRGAGGIAMCDICTPDIEGHLGIHLDEGHEAYDESAEKLHNILSDEEDREKEHSTYKKEDVAVDWVAVTNKYFVAALIPRGGFPEKAEAYMYSTQSLNEEYDERKCSVESGVAWQTTLPAKGEAVEMDFTFLTTSRENDTLAEFKNIGMAALVEDGGFLSFVTVPIVLVLRGLHSIGIGYGLAILILTAFIRIAMFPLSRKQQMIQHKTQRLAPLLKQIKQKHKGDRTKLNEETMKLYSKHGVNPLFGCLPLLIQMPILIGLFTALRTAIELRKAVFLYIPDLSIADGAGLGWLLNWNFLGIKTFYYINPLAIAMGLVYYLYMKTTPKTKSDDPQQQSMQKMMSFMPLMMFILLYNYAAGLALYITFGAIVGIFENRIARKMVEAELEKNPIEAPVTPAKHGKKKK